MEAVAQGTDHETGACAQIGLFIGREQAQGRRHGDLPDELGPQVAALLGAVHDVAAEELFEDIGGIAGPGRLGRVDEGREDLLPDNGTQDVIARDVEPVMEFGMGRHAGGGARIVLELEGSDGQVRGPAADIDSGHTQTGMPAVFRTRAAHHGAEQLCVPLILVGDLVIDIDELGTCGFIPVAAHTRVGAEIQLAV